MAIHNRDKSLKRLMEAIDIKLEMIMAVEKDLVVAVADLDASITALEQKPDSTPGSGVVSQAVLDQAVVDLAAEKARVDAEAAKK
jgi:hypothetical protein